MLVLLDFSRAFDKEEIEMIKSYLVQRIWFVRTERGSSRELLLRLGVPQGSILDHLLFTIYTRMYTCMLTILNYAN